MGNFIQANFNETLKAINGINKKQLPFAFAVSLTKLAQASRDEIRKQMKRNFTIRSQRVPKGVKLKPAKKSDYKTRNMESHVLEMDDFMTQHEFGTTKRPTQSRNIAVPSKQLQASGRTLTGKMKKSKKPKSFLSKLNAPPRKRKWGRHRTPRPFFVRVKSGKIAIAIRETNARMPIKYLYFFKKSTEQTERLHFEDITTGIVRSKKDAVFRREYAAAIRSAR